ncbi:MAG: FAD-dependent oxidoreductase [Pseudomonadota bacterium]
MSDHFDLVVVGGGIHGAGVAQAAACAGYTVLVLEQTALAAGTSSRSSKLIHGGLRYLESHAWGLVRESLHERSVLLRIAPELVRLQPFHIPVYPDTMRRPLTLRAGLSLYAMLGGWRRSSLYRTLPRRLWETLDGLDTRGLQAVFRYFDAQTDDVALTRAVMQSAVRLGATLACPAEFSAARIDTHGCSISYLQRGIDKHCTATVLVNAGGPWADRIDARIEPQPSRIPIELVQGAHLVVPGRLEHGCYYMEAPRDRRAIFLLPWGEHALLGTTEHRYGGDPAAVCARADEESYLLEVLAHYFPRRPATVMARFAGLRVLPAADGTAFGRSRETMLRMDDSRRPRLVSIYGGKLTGYRATATKVLRALQRTLPPRTARGDTAVLKLVPVS